MKHIEVRGSRIPALGLGTWQLRGEICQEVVEQALELGYRAIDTARAYENEVEVGAAIAASRIPREQLFITTKIWPDDLTDPSATDVSLDRLQTDYLDLLLVHWPNETLSLEQMLEPLLRAHEAKKARLIGVSNFPSKLLREALALAPLACNQVEYHPYLSQDSVLALVRKHGLALTAYCPLARGLAGKDAVIAEIAQRHGKTPEQVTLRWLIQQDRVIAIPKSSNKQRLASNLDIFDFELDGAEMARIHGLARGRRLVNPDFAPAWDEH